MDFKEIVERLSQEIEGKIDNIILQQDHENIEVALANVFKEFDIEAEIRRKIQEWATKDSLTLEFDDDSTEISSKEMIDLVLEYGLIDKIKDAIINKYKTALPREEKKLEQESANIPEGAKRPIGAKILTPDITVSDENFKKKPQSVEFKTDYKGAVEVEIFCEKGFKGKIRYNNKLNPEFTCENPKPE